MALGKGYLGFRERQISMTEQEQIEKSLRRIERYIDALKYHIHLNNLLLQEAVIEITKLTGEPAHTNNLCIRVTKARESLTTLRNLIPEELSK